MGEMCHVPPPRYYEAVDCYDWLSICAITYFNNGPIVEEVRRTNMIIRILTTIVIMTIVNGAVHKTNKCIYS